MTYAQLNQRIPLSCAAAPQRSLVLSTDVKKHHHRGGPRLLHLSSCHGSRSNTHCVLPRSPSYKQHWAAVMTSRASRQARPRRGEPSPQKGAAVEAVSDPFVKALRVADTNRGTACRAIFRSHSGVSTATFFAAVQSGELQADERDTLPLSL